MNSRNDKLNYIKNLIREEVKSELKRGKRFLYEMEDPKIPFLEVDASSYDGSASVFIRNLSNKYRNLILNGFDILEDGGNSKLQDADNTYIKIIVKLDSKKIALSKNNFKIQTSNNTVTLFFTPPSPDISGVVNITCPGYIKTIDHDMKPMGRNRYGF
jgi:hypothetical protein